MEALAAYPPIARRLLANRGVSSAAQAELYLTPDRRLLPPPALLPDMDRAIARLYRALLSGERIAIYGDFDADGVTATALLLEALRALGADPVAYIPHRIEEGHGLNRGALERLAAAGCTLVVTADCGITGLPGPDSSSRPGSEPALSLPKGPPGLDLIITDHHLPGPRLPAAVAAVDPQRPDASGYPWPDLAGVGVAFKLVQGLYESLGRPWDETLLELVALGTVADVAPLVGENRYLVREGLQHLRRTRRPGLRALARRAGYDLAALDEEAIGYGLGPRLNAAGRMAHADLSLRLLLATDEAEGEALAAELSRLNELRQRATQEVVERARQAVLAADTLEPLLMVGAPDFPPGIVGLAA
ncbi:MAG: single-stranded-DNA-specific exonuclease RecJ, partial [Chloroflexi bacterium]|nr:single-stranded-DNA-specific exonuclease RecJ [Chloroflexota bacterium]